MQTPYLPLIDANNKPIIRPIYKPIIHPIYNEIDLKKNTNADWRPFRDSFSLGSVWNG